MCIGNDATSFYGFAVYTAAYRRDNAIVRIPAQRAATRRNRKQVPWVPARVHEKRFWLVVLLLDFYLPS